MRVLMLMLLVVGCDREAETVTIRPTLACGEAVHCRAYQWSVGLPRNIGGVRLAGTHIRCHCYANLERTDVPLLQSR
jgi:threonine dehydrogenase-like Zn-dependent dehydrogenase